MVKFSVKKPLTVFVAVIAIIVLSVVAIKNMTPDLLPNMDMPYVMVITAYPGASPEKVETVITKPLEQAMATLENIKQITSTSSQNVSQITMEFNSDVNMDTVSVDILQKINLIEGYWDDTVQTPMIIKINPSMLPIMVAAVDMEGMDTIELSAFVNDTLMNKLEGIAGVASINAEGIIEESINVALNQEKIDKTNDKIAKAINKQFDEVETELSDAKGEVEENLAATQDALAEVQKGKNQLNSMIAAGEKEINSKQLELIEAEEMMLTQLEELETQMVQITAQETMLKELYSGVQRLENTVADNNALADELRSIQNTLTALDTQSAQFNASIDSIRNNQNLSDVEKEEQINAIRNSEAYIQMQAAYSEQDMKLSARGIDRQGIPRAIAAIEASSAVAKGALSALDNTLSGMGISRADLPTALSEIAAGKKALQEGIDMLKAAFSELEGGGSALEDAMRELESQKANASSQLSSATNQILEGQAALGDALVEIDDGLEQIDEQRELALEQVDMNTTLTVDMLSNILKAQNFFMPAGYVSKDDVDYLVTVGETFETVEEISGLLISDLGIDGLDPIYLRDVADVELINNAEDIYAKINGNDGVLLTFSKQSSYATATVSDSVSKKFTELEAEYEGLSFSSMMDQGDYIHIVVSTILNNLLMGAVFAIIILYLFLRDIKPTFITLCSIPISVLFALTLMYFSGVTINIISLSGLAVSVGMLVDNSVVVIENVYRLRKNGASAVQAAVSGTAQVAGAIAASTLTTVCVFAPIVFVQGITRKLFSDMALTLAYSLGASLVIALTVVPAMSSNILNKVKDTHGRYFDGFLNGYKKAVNWALDHKAIVLLASVALLISSSAIVVMRGYTFMPNMDMPQLSVSLSMPEGSTSYETMDMSDIVIDKIYSIEDVETVGAIIDSSGESVTMYVTLGDDASLSGNQVSKEIEDRCRDLDCEVSASGSGGAEMMAYLGGSGVAINVYGDNLDDMRDSAKEIAALLEEVDGAENVTDGYEDSDPEIRFVVDKDKAMQEGLTVAQIYMEIAEALTTEISSTTASIQGNSYDVVVLKDAEASMTPAKIKNLILNVTSFDGTEKEVRIRDIADVVETETLQSIKRTDQRRYVTVSSDVREDSNVTLVSSAFEKKLKDLELPPGITVELSGENESIQEAFEDLALMLVIGIILVYLIMVAQFQSLKSPFIVMFTIPLAFTGGLLALLVTGFELSVISLIGFVMLVGIIVNNGIVLVDYINQLREEGMELREATITAGVTRMRPILMTTMTTILGLISMAIGVGTGAELMQPVAIVCIGGLLYATIMTLFVVPVMYTMMSRKEMRVISQEELEVIED